MGSDSPAPTPAPHAWTEIKSFQAGPDMNPAVFQLLSFAVSLYCMPGPGLVPRATDMIKMHTYLNLS